MRRQQQSLAIRLTLLACTVIAVNSARPLAAQLNQRAAYDTERLTALLTKIVVEEKVPGLAIGIVDDGKLIYSQAFGAMKWGDARAPMTPETLFHMASVTKPFVATAVMQLVEQGKVDLDAPVTKYLPYFHIKDPRGESITVRQMLTHTSGMPDVADYGWDKPEYDNGALERYVRSLGDKELRWEPGSKFAYSNMAYEVLGDLIAKVSGVSFEDYVEAHILKPLGMKSSTLLLKVADPAKLAAGHTKSRDGVVSAITHYPYNRAHSPSSNLHSNIEEMARWLMANINRGELDGQRILRDETYDLMWKPAADAGNGRSLGISWFLEDVKGERVVSHGGRDTGFSTFVAMVPARKIGVVILMNTDRSPPNTVRQSIVATALGWELPQ